MRFSDFWRGGPDRERNEREQDRWRLASGERDQRREQGQPQEEGFERRGWRPGSDYYGNTPQRYGAGGYGGEDYESQRRYETSGGDWDDPYRRSANDRWQDSYSGRNTTRSGESSAGCGRSTSGVDSGSYRGRGPKGYRRSDARIREDACECLTDDDWIDASNIEVLVVDSEVTLSGTVNSRDDKRRAENLVERLTGVKDVNNNLRVSSEAGQREGTTAEGRQSTSSQSAQSGQTSQSSRH
jgi:hypothetical protein